MGISHLGLQRLVPNIISDTGLSPSLGDLLLWAESDIDTFQQSDGTVPAISNNDVVGYWGDQSGNDNHVTRTTTSKKFTLKTNRINGLPALSVDALDDSLLSGGVDVGRTLFVVASNNKAGFPPVFTQNTLFDHFAGAFEVTQFSNFNHGGSGSLKPFFLSPAWGTSFRILTIKIDAAAPLGEYLWDGILQASDSVGSASTVTNKTIVIGNTLAEDDGWDGEVAAILYYGVLKSDEEINQTGQYLASKYGLSWSDL